MISIVVPIYNASEYLDDCLRSIQLQDYVDFEVLCVDDGSIDNSADIVKQYTEQDQRFKLYQQSNAGVSVARNTGLKYAQGEYVCFVDADDIIASKYLNTLYNSCDGGSFAICGYTKDINLLGKKQGCNLIYTSIQFISKVVDESIEHPNLWAMMFKTNIIKENNIEFYPGCVRNEDTEFYMKYLVHEKNNVIVLDYKGYFYRDNPNSAMHITKRNAFTSFEASERIEKYLMVNGISMDYNKMLFGSIQAYAVRLAQEGNIGLYEELHKLYNVHNVMQRLLKHPRLLRRVVSFLYIILRAKIFYRLFSLINR